jgi:hypothetical protein
VVIDSSLWNHARAIDQVEIASMQGFHKSWVATKCGARV